MKTNSLILVRHSEPEISFNLPANEWDLSEIGRNRCVPLADKLKKYQPTAVFTSNEKKAFQTGAILAQRLEINSITMSDLHEHERNNVRFGSQELFENKVKLFFNEPSKLVFGRESADHALMRFAAAISKIMDFRPQGSMVIVAHGAVIALWVTSISGGDPFTFWKRQGMPSFSVFLKPNLEFVEFVEYVS